MPGTRLLLHSPNRIRRSPARTAKRPVTALILLFCLAFTVPGAAKDTTLETILGYLADAGIIDPAILDAKDYIACLVDNNDPIACSGVQDIAKQQADQAKNEAISEAEMQAQAFLPDDPAVKAAVDVIRAAYAGKWLKVLETTGVKLLGLVACKAGLYWSGPLDPFICGKWASVVLEKAEPVVHETLVVLEPWPNVNLWRLVSLFGFDLACEMAPEIPLKNEACSLLGKAFEALSSLGKQLAEWASAAASGLNKLVSGGGSQAMTKEQYYNHVVQPLMLRRALERFTLGRKDLGLNDSELKQCIEYGGLAFGAACGGEFNDRLREEAEALVDLIQQLPDTYYQAWLSDAAIERAYARYGSPEAEAYQNYILGLPRNQWDALVGGNLPVQMFTGNAPDAQDFYKKIFFECGSRVSHMLLGTTAEPVFDDLEPHRLTSWACYQAAGKRFAAGYIAEEKHLQTVLTGLGQLGCPAKSGSSTPQLECLTYVSWGLCLQQSRVLYDKNLFCGIDRMSAAQALGGRLVGTLGEKRCQYIPNTKGSSGEFQPRVQCLRPWKQQTCDALLENFRVRYALPPGRIEMQCTYRETPEFKAELQHAKELVAALNHNPQHAMEPVTQPDDSARRRVGKCRSLWDPLSISCYGEKAAPPLPAQFSGKSLQTCEADPNRDGADAVCYVPDWTYSKSASDTALAQRGVATQVPVQPVQPPSAVGPETRRDNQRSTTKEPDPSGAGEQAQQRVSEPQGATCDFDLRYLAPQPPVLETSARSLVAGTQARITCRYEISTRTVMLPSCDERSRRTRDIFRGTDQATARVLSAMIVIDGQLTYVSSIPAGSQNFEKTAIWSFRDAGSHTVSCQIDNPLGSQIRGADAYVGEAVSVQVGAVSEAVTPEGFDPAQARSLPTQRVAPTTDLAPRATREGLSDSGQHVFQGADEDEIPMPPDPPDDKGGASAELPAIQVPEDEISPSSMPAKPE